MRFLRIWLLLVSFLLTTHIYGQQTPQWTQYAFNQYAINPAYAGLDRSLSITAGLRSQWSRFDGAPKTQLLSGHLPMYFLKGSVGMLLVNDALGQFQRTAATVSYNYIVDSPVGLFSTGLRFGYQQISLNNENLRTPSGNYNDNTFDHQDPRLLDADLSGYAPVWSLGFFFSKDLLELGISMDNVPGNSIEAGNSTFNEKVVVSLYGSYQYGLTEILAVEPNFLIKTDGAQTQLDIGAIAHYNQFIGGLSFRGYNANSIDAVGVIAGVRVSNNVRVTYSFDLGLSEIRQFHDGTHEFLINYNLNKPIRTGELPRIIYNPRYN